MTRSLNGWVVGGLVVLAANGVHADDSATTCRTCHAPQAARLAASVHSTLECQECHGGARTFDVTATDVARLYPPSRPAGSTFDHGDGFRGKPSRLDIPETCGTCHADVERMNPYGLHVDQLARYKTSGHGKALFGKQDTSVAVCTDCHGPPHDVLKSEEPNSRTNPRNVPDTCAACHADEALMKQHDLPWQIPDEYRKSVHGAALLERGDTGAPTCATCHGNHSALPPGFSSVGAVCGQCHEHDAKFFAQSVHADQPGFRGCVQCHGGGIGHYDHLIARITQPAGIMIQRYAHLLSTEGTPTQERMAESIHPDAKQIVMGAMPSCEDCHDALEDDASLQKLTGLLDDISLAEQRFVVTANRLDEVSQGVLLVENQRFKFQDAKTHLIALAPLQHTLDTTLVAGKIADLNAVCDEVNGDLDKLQEGLAWRRRLLIFVWIFAVLFAGVLYAKFKRLKAAQVHPGCGSVPAGAPLVARRTFLDVLVGMGSALVGLALAVPALAYLWPAAKGGASSDVEVERADSLQLGQSTMVQSGGKPIIVVRGRQGYRAFSATCTHLGCLVRWDDASHEFKCPCHAAVFDANGKVVSGPPPSPLPEFNVNEVGGKVYVSLKV